MQVPGLSSASQLNFGRISLPPPKIVNRFASADSDTWLSMQRDTTALRDEISKLGKLLGPRGSRLGSSVASVTSASGLNLISSGVASKRRSAEEINTERLSFDPSIGWNKGSTATPTVGGEYTGTGNETYSFKVKQALSPTKDAEIEIKDSAGDVVDYLYVSNADLDTTEFAFGEGMTVQFASGTIRNKDNFDVDVFEPVEQDVNENNPMNGVGLAGANLETGFTVTDGAFTVNGTSVAVSATDSITDVLDRITADTDVTATYDAANEKVVLIHKTLGAEQIDLAGDTSGFLAAMKLDTSTLELGTDGTTGGPMSSLPQFAGVTAGDITVNGVNISFDPAVDSLNDLLARVEGSGAGVNTLVVDNDRITFRNLDKNADLTLADNGTGFFNAIGMATGTFEPSATTSKGVSGAVAKKIADSTAEIGRLMSKIMNTVGEGDDAKSYGAAFATEARKFATEAFDIASGKTTFKSKFGLTFDMKEGGEDLFDYSRSGKRALTSVLGRNYNSFKSAMTEPVGTGDASFLDKIDGLAKELFDATRKQLELAL